MWVSRAVKHRGAGASRRVLYPLPRFQREPLKELLEEAGRKAASFLTGAESAERVETVFERRMEKPFYQ
ncbi:MAG: hypothetical protein FGF48_04605 [Candidatus Brockarchaeota archaeon]|nr:hypothetical protein [Candidatus Brockarchaeota archaeon]